MEPGKVQVRGVTGNGLPGFKPYIYRGTGEDIMPWADSGDGSMNYERESTKSLDDRWRCMSCGHGYRSGKHRKSCG